MSLLSMLRGLFLTASNAPVTDMREAKCPACQTQLAKVPSRKTKCPHCNRFIYVRTRPQTNERIVVTENDAEKIDGDWALLNGTHDTYIQNNRYKKMTVDEKWTYLKNQLEMHLRNKDLGLYRNTVLTMAELLIKGDQPKDALSYFLYICYLDLNGAKNCGGQNDDSRSFKKIRPFDRHLSFLAPNSIEKIIDLTQSLKLPHKDVKDIFMEFMRDIHPALNAPITPDKCWMRIEKEAWPKDPPTSRRTDDPCNVEFIELVKSGQKGKLAYFDTKGNACSIEDSVKDYFQSNGYKVLRGEVRFWQAMFGLAFWEEIFDGTGTPNALNDIPSDLFSGESFYQARKDKIDKKMQFLCNTNIGEFISSQLLKHEKSWTRIVFENGHDDDYRTTLKSQDVTDFLNIINPTIFSKIVYRIAKNPTEYRAGTPDFNIWKGNDVSFIEVKGSRESIRDSQMSWLTWMHAEGMPVKIIRVIGIVP